MVASYEMVTGQAADWLEPDYAEIVTTAATLAIGSAAPGANRSAFLEFMVDDVDATFTHLNGRAELAHESKALAWGNRSDQFRDPEGTVVSLFTPVTDAARTRFGSR